MKSYSLDMAAQDNPAFNPEDGHSADHMTGKAGDQQNGKGLDTDTDWKKEQEQEQEQEEEEEEEEDPWTVTSLKQDYTPWDELTQRQKVKRAVLYPVKIVLVLGFLYLFICSLDFLSSAFKLLGGKQAGQVFQQSDILTNPVAGLMMGVLVTVLVQSSSTSTSIVISMVGAGILTAKTAVPIVMGANIGTSVTNTIVALGQITNKADFRRAFAGATVHDMFNWLTVLVLLPLEIITGYLFRLSDAIVNSMHLNETLDVNQDLLKTITKPFTTLIIQVSSSGIKKIATGDLKAEDATLMKLCCDDTKPKDCCKDHLKDLAANKTLYGAVQRYTHQEREAVCQDVDQCVMQDYHTNAEELQQCVTYPWKTANVTAVYDNLNTLVCKDLPSNNTQHDCCSGLLTGSPFYTDFTKNATIDEKEALCSSVNTTCYAGSDMYDACTKAWVLGREDKGVGEEFDCGNWTETIGRTCNSKCEFLFRETHLKEGGPLSDEAIGGILLVISLILLCTCLVCIVKLLHSLLQGPMARMIKKFVNADFPGYCGYLTGYLAILIGAGMTILVQSSSIFTSTLTPLVGLGVITLDRMYPLTLGSNIGTTATGILAALAQDVDSIPRSLQVAFAHLFFNISGIILFYPLPFMRIPIPAAKFLGTTTAKYRWFAIVYLILMFFLFPLGVFGLSIPGWYVLAIVLIPIGVLVITIGIIKCVQAKKPALLPSILQNWKFLPEPLRSLVPYDKVMKKICFCARFQDESPEREERGKEGEGKTNQAFDGVVSTSM